MTIEILPFEERYTEAVQHLITSIQKSEFGIDISLNDQPDLQDIVSFYRKGLGDFWVAISDGEIVGTIALIDIGGREVALRKMFVAEAFRGKQHGVAGRLLNHVFDYAKRKTLSRILLGTTDKFIAAHRFYEKNGFDLIDVNDLPGSFPKMAVDTRFYVRSFEEDN